MAGPAGFGVDPGKARKKEEGGAVGGDPLAQLHMREPAIERDRGDGGAHAAGGRPRHDLEPDPVAWRLSGLAGAIEAVEGLEQEIQRARRVGAGRDRSRHDEADVEDGKSVQVRVLRLAHSVRLPWNDAGSLPYVN